MKQVFSARLGWMTVFFLALGLASPATFAAEETAKPESAARVKYRGSKEINFEKLLIEGQLKRKQITVVTGNAQDGTDGLLRLRENFLDRVAVDAGEEVQ